jgi:TPR repeat protein
MSRLVLPFVLVAATMLSGCGYHLSGRQWTADSVIAEADGGDAVAQRITGDMYYWGEDVPRSWPLAQAYWEMAAAQGEPLALQRLANLRNGQAIRVVSDGSAGRDTFGGTGASGGDEETL